MKIQPKTVVKLSYNLEVGGDQVDQATEQQPFQFIHGIGQTLEAFDQKLQDLEPGQQFDFELEPEEGYGAYNKEYVINVEKAVFQVEGAPDDLLQVGKTIPMQDQGGNTLYGVVSEIEESHVVMDFNHPLAGQKLHFTGKIIEVREATPSELDMGRAAEEG